MSGSTGEMGAAPGIRAPQIEEKTISLKDLQEAYHSRKILGYAGVNIIPWSRNPTHTGPDRCVGLRMYVEYEDFPLGFLIQYLNDRGLYSVLYEAMRDELNVKKIAMVNASPFTVVPFPFGLWASPLFIAQPTFQHFEGFTFREPEFPMHLPRFELSQCELQVSARFKE